MDLVQRALERAEGELPSLEAAKEAEPGNPETHFRLALTLSSVGREDEALMEYEKTLQDPEGLFRYCFRALWNNIGWYFYRRGEYQEELKRFDQTCAVANVDEAVGQGDCRLAMEMTILWRARSMISARGRTDA